MKLKLAALLVTALFTTSASAVSYTSTGGFSNTTANSNTQTHNVTYIEGTSVVESHDISSGGLDHSNTCISPNCQGSDNITTGHSVVTTDTSLVVTQTGSTNRQSNTASCFSGANMNGLGHMESRSHENFSVAGVSNVSVTGSVVEHTEITATTTNGGAEVGSVVENSTSTTHVSENTNTTFSTVGETITFSSSVGQ